MVALQLRYKARIPALLPSISFYERVFRKKFWHQKLQGCVLVLKFFGAKILFEKLA
jgi:hypothetical protein